MKHSYRQDSGSVSGAVLMPRVSPAVSAGARFPLTRLDIATLAAGITRHSADAALHAKLISAGLLREDARTGYIHLTPKGYALLEDNGYIFDPKQGWRLDTAQAVRLLQRR
ncbi:MAG TPA: hypothetical protein VLC92_20890 [Rhodocyclaceae bacterium]|nr:hypothetical protein [Rhodocyclaceae bacterium]